MAEDRAQALEAAAFLGETLGPLFLYEPGSPEAAPLYEELRVLDVAAAAAEWPLAPAGDAARALGSISEGLAAAGSDADDGLLWEYRRLFVGPAAKAAPPWGSVYTDRECVIFGEATLRLRAWLRRADIQMPGEGKEPEDHIGLMLLLMAWIARHRPELFDEYLSDHLLTWAPHFLEIVQAQSGHPFFQGLALLTSSSLQGLQESLGLTVVTPRFYR